MRLFALICLFIFSIQSTITSQNLIPYNAPSGQLEKNNAGSATQEPKLKWSKTFAPTRSFIENKGQFNKSFAGAKVQYAVDNGSSFVYFTKKGLTYHFVKKEINPAYEAWEDEHEHGNAENRKKEYEEKQKKEHGRKWEREEEEERNVAGEGPFKKYITKDYYYTVSWVGANSSVELSGESKVKDYNNYAMTAKDKSVYSIDYVPGYEKVVYKNLYPGIDVEYTFHPETGIKYALIVHAGADVSKVKMSFPTNAVSGIDEAGELKITTPFGDILEHAPVTYYAGSSSNVIPSKFVKNGKTFSFDLGDYNHSNTVVIDPWVVLPTLPAANCVWECDKDALGNVYVIGGDKPMKLQKYDINGVLQWTYNTPYDTTNGDWLGTMATDLTGNCYVTRGSSAAIMKVNAAGILQFSRNGNGNDEYWSIAFNCDQTKLIVGGTRLGFFPPAGSNGVIFDINTTTGAVSNVALVAGLRPGPLISDINEVRAITSSKNAKYYYLTLDSIGAISQDFNLCPSGDVLFSRVSGYNFSYKSENYRPSNGNSGICDIKANDHFVYTQNGIRVEKRSLITGAIITSVSIPGGNNTATFGQNQPGNGGIDIDACGNVYVGSSDRVLKYDANLTLLTTVNLPFKVFDLAVNTNGEVIVCGGTGTSSSTTRTGYLQAVAMSACAPFALVCCNPTICPKGPLCTSDAPVTLIAATGGGVWSGTGITNTTTGVFSPAVAGVGTFTIVYTLACGSDTIFIKVNNCATLTVCAENNGQYTVTGGTGPYTWQHGVPFQNCTGCTFGICLPPICNGFPDTTWTTYATTATATPPGTFPIRVKDSGVNVITFNSANGIAPCHPCPNIQTFVLSQTTTSCPTTSDGHATVGASAGVPPYTYTWQPGGLTGATQTTLSATTYTVYVLDSNGCRDTTTVTILAGTGPTANVTTTPTTCGGNNGTATANISGAGPFTFAWSSGGSTQTVSNLPSGSYTVTVTAAGGCSVVASGTVASSSGLAANVTVTNATCGASNGTATANVTAGTGPYTYAWSNSGNTQTISNLAANTYTVTVTGAGGCSVVASNSVSTTAGVIANVTVTATTCGSNNGTAAANVTSGTGPFTYAWSNSGNTQVISNIASGPYTVTITGAGGCSVVASGTVPSSNALAANVTVTAAACGGNNGTATANVTAGAGPYTYAWSNSGNTSTINNLAANTYTVTVTGAGGCTVVASGTVTTTTGLSANVTVTQATCGTNNGTATANVTAGVGPYAYAWSNSGNTQTISNLAAATYTVTVTGAGGCSVVASGTVTATSAVTVTATSTRDTCGRGVGTGSSNPTGGVSPYTYQWTGGATTQNINGLSPGTYSVVVTDNVGCTATTSITVTATPIVTANVTVTPTTCGRNNGSATAIGGGGTGAYTYNWGNGATTSSLTNVISGTYPVTISDALGCTASANGIIPASTAIVANVTVTPTTCGNNNGSATANVSAGAGPFTYLWSNSGTTQTISNLAAASYTVTVTGAGGCSVTASGTVTSNGTMTLTVSNPVDPTCAGHDGHVTVALTGGTAPYTVTIDTGGTPIVINAPSAFNQTVNGLPSGTVNITVVDAQGCQKTGSASLGVPNCCTFTISTALTPPTCGQSNGNIVITPSNGSGNYGYTWAGGAGSGNTGSNLASGNYAVTITDNAYAGCQIDTVFSLNSNSTLAVTISNIHFPTCKLNDGQLDINVTGGTAPYVITVDTGGTPVVINSPGTYQQTWAGLYPGTVNVSAVDASGCQSNTSTIMPYPNCCHFSVLTSIIPATCGLPNGAILVSAINGTNHYSYNWASGLGTGNTLSNLQAGTYQITVIDSGYLNCFRDTSFTIAGTTAPQVGLGNVTNPSCIGNDGHVNLTVSSGTPPYTVTIDTGGTPFVVHSPGVFSQTLSNLGAGTVSVSVVDSLGCRDSASVTLVNPNCCTFTISTALTQPTCGQSNGSIVITATNGSGNYGYTWANGAGSGNTASNLAAGTYPVTITDNAHAGCEIDTSFTLNSTSSLSISNGQITKVNCYGDSTGAISITVNGGTTPYTYAWSNGETTATATHLPAGIYTVTVSDAHSCIITLTDTIVQSPALGLQISTTAASCATPDSGSATATVTGGVGAYTYHWSNSATSPTITGVFAGQYNVTVTDSLGCQISGTGTVTGDSVPVFDLGVDRTICAGDSVVLNTGYANTVWSDGHTGATYTADSAGTVWATVTSGGCSATDTVKFDIAQVPGVPEMNLSDTLICAGEEVILSVTDFHFHYIWSTGDTGLHTTVSLAGTYMVSATNGCGTSVAQAIVTVDDTCYCRIFVPNAFSPNNDGANDAFKVYNTCNNIDDFSITLYNRWGDVVYKSSDINGTWDGSFSGKRSNEGVYIYTLSYKTWLKGGMKEVKQKGSVVLIW